MNYEEIKLGIAEDAKIPLKTNKKMIERRIKQCLDKLNVLVRWPFAIDDFEKTLSANGNSLNVPNTMFRPVAISITLSSGTQYPLDYINYSDFKRINDQQTTTVITPGKWSFAKNKLWIGPGNISAAATVYCDFQRKLTTRDIPYIPDGNVIIDWCLSRIFKRGTPAWISAKGAYNEGIRDMKETFKISAIQKGRRQKDKRIVSNISYMKSFKTGV